MEEIIMIENDPNNKKNSFWTTIPGYLTAFAAVITAVAGLLTALDQTSFLDIGGLFSKKVYSLGGAWEGIIQVETSDSKTKVKLFLENTCELGEICGTISTPARSADLQLINVDDQTYEFLELNSTGIEDYSGGGHVYLRLVNDEVLSFAFNYELIASKGTLYKINE
jgi:hypothetical protein